jgi:hypothetical protein
LKQIPQRSVNHAFVQTVRINLFETPVSEMNRNVGVTAMTASSMDVEALALMALEAIQDKPGDASPLDTSNQQRFYEMIVLILGNLYAKTPVPNTLFDRATLSRITTGMDDGDAGKLTARGEDWLRLEGLIRQQEGAKTCFLTRPSLAVLSTLTAQGPLGEVMDKILKRYQEAMPSDSLRRATRILGSYFLTRVARS